jgi:hypothetical protein
MEEQKVTFEEQVLKASVTELKAGLFDISQAMRPLQYQAEVIAKELEKRNKEAQLPTEPVTNGEQTEQEKPEEIGDTETTHKEE